MSEARSSAFSITNILAFTILLASSLWLGWWFYDRSQYVYIDDAHIASTMISVSSRIPGWVVEFPVDEGERVNVGQTLVSIDARDVKLQLSELEASLATQQSEYERKQSELAMSKEQISSNIEAQRSALAAAEAGLSGAQVELTQSEKDLNRAKSLLRQKMISDETFEERKTKYDIAVQSHHRNEAEVSAAKAKLLSAQADLARLDVLNKELEIIRGKRNELEVQRERLTNQLSDHIISSPISGVVDETFINSGEYVYPGQRILMLHDPNHVWVKANIKETEVRHIQIGSEVRISVDAYPGKTWKGHISNIGNAATSQFAMLPAPNPSGNFTKITQRLEIKVKFEANEEKFKPGMMVELQIVADG